MDVAIESVALLAEPDELPTQSVLEPALIVTGAEYCDTPFASVTPTPIEVPAAMSTVPGECARSSNGQHKAQTLTLPRVLDSQV